MSNSIVPGIAFVGTIPIEIQKVTIYGAVLTRSAGGLEAASALIRFLTSRQAEAAILRAGLTPLARR